MQSESPHRTVQHDESRHSIQPEVTAQPVTTREMGFDAARRNSVPERRHLAAIQAVCASSASRSGRSRSVCDRCAGIAWCRRPFFSGAVWLTPEDRWHVWHRSSSKQSETRRKSRDRHRPVSPQSPELRCWPTFPLKRYSRNSRYDLRGAEDPRATVTAARNSPVPVHIGRTRSVIYVFRQPEGGPDRMNQSCRTILTFGF
jgi:hypothetical protein